MLSTLAAQLDTAGASKRRAIRTGWPSRSCDGVKFHDTAKVQYRYRAAGQGPALVFAADPPVTLECYDDLIARYARDFRVIVFEMPTMGFSAAARGFTFGFHETNDDVAEFLRAVAGPGAVLAFSCVAGLAAVDIAVRHADLASRLVLIQTTDWEGFQNWKATRDPKNILGKPFIGQLAMNQLKKSRAPLWFDLAIGNRACYDPLSAQAKETIAHGAGWALASAFQRYMRSKSSPLGTPAQPVHVIWGKADRSHPADSLARAGNLAPGAEIIAGEEFGHFGELEAPDFVHGVIATRVFGSRNP